MPIGTKHHSIDVIIAILREAETTNKDLRDYVREKGISRQTYYRWRSDEFNGP